MYENKNVKVDETTITFKGLFGRGKSYKKSKVIDVDTQKFGIFGKILGIVNMILIFNFSHGRHQFNGDVLVKLKMRTMPLKTKEFQIWVHKSELDEFLDLL